MRCLSLSLMALLLGSCDAPPVVSFNTPELCTLDVTGLTSFSEARAQCGKDCSLCVESTVNDRVSTYALSHDERCVCPAPEEVDAGGGLSPRLDGGPPPPVLDAGSGVKDAGRGSLDAASPDDSTPEGGDSGTYRPSAACANLLHLTFGEAQEFCREKDDCHVCVERINIEGEPRSYLAHACGCPDPYRLD